MSTLPVLPTELLELIVYATWHFPLSTKERVAFMVTSTSISKAWAELYDIVSSTDVFLLTEAYAKKYLSVLEGRDAFRYTQLRRRVKSITLTLDYGPLPRQPGKPYKSPDMWLTASFLLRILNSRSQHDFPELRRLNIQHANPPFDDDIFDLVRHNPLPNFITELELSYDHYHTPSSIITQRQENYSRSPKDLEVQFPGIQTLHFKGAPRPLIHDFAKQCINMKTMTIDLAQPICSGVKYCRMDFDASPPEDQVICHEEYLPGVASMTFMREGKDILHGYAVDPSSRRTDFH